MARTSTNASVTLARETFARVESLAEQCNGQNFSRTAAQLIEIALMALDCGWQPPGDWWPYSGRQVIYHRYAVRGGGAPVLPVSAKALDAAPLDGALLDGALRVWPDEGLEPDVIDPVPRAEPRPSAKDLL